MHARWLLVQCVLAVASSVAMADPPPPTFNKSSDLCPRQSPVQLEQRSVAELLTDRCTYRDMGRRSMAVEGQTADPGVRCDTKHTPAGHRPLPEGLARGLALSPRPALSVLWAVR